MAEKFENSMWNWNGHWIEYTKYFSTEDWMWHLIAVKLENYSTAFKLSTTSKTELDEWFKNFCNSLQETDEYKEKREQKERDKKSWKNRWNRHVIY